ncbi:MAG: Nudix family hydrolase [Rhodocyclaceae bacterium]|nr:Nudix family hydrolase [Rhodocyclaceae bacterium]
MKTPKTVHVAAAVIERTDGSFLLGQRAPDTVYAGYWEFPGGKIEAGETAHAALVRELHEELGIEVVRADPWLHREHHYEHAHVHLNIFRVSEWHGEITDHVHSALSWQAPDAINVAPMLPANAPVLAALALPTMYGITRAATVGVSQQLSELRSALESGLRLVQIREPALATSEREAFARDAVALCHQFGARVLINSDIALAQKSGADGVHLTARQIATLAVRPPLPLVGTSCHSAQELAHAAAIGCDFAVLGPVKPTESHPGEQGLGWVKFAAVLATEHATPPLPIYAIGGLSQADLDDARRAGAHGIAAIRAAWSSSAT